MRLRAPNNKKGKPRRRNDGTLFKGTSFPRHFGAKGSIVTVHNNILKDAKAQGQRALGGRYCWNPVLRYWYETMLKDQERAPLT